MKLHLPALLCSALLACMAASPSAHADTFTAEGVTVTGSTYSYLGDSYTTVATLGSDTNRFYDGGKGTYWDGYNSVVRAGAVELFEASGNSFSFLGDLQTRIPASSSSSCTASSFQNLTDDGQLCWAYTSSNVLQYWQSYYGVFAKKAGDTSKAAPIHGYTYDEANLSKLGGTQSLKLNMEFYDKWKNTGGTSQAALAWYLGGLSSESLENPKAASGGYFATYFPDATQSTDYTTYHWGGDSYERFSANLKTLFGQDDGTKGQIVHLDLWSSGYTGHAVTCYGYETDADGNITAVYIANSDDQAHGLIKLTVKWEAMSNGTGAVLYDGDYKWTYAGKDWRITSMNAIDTPDVLKSMLAEYESGNQVWMGNLESWTDPITVEADVNVLPTDETGWMVYAGTDTEHAGYYNAYYSNERGVEFNDDALSSTVKVAEDIAVTSMEVNNSEKDYVFSGEGQTIRTVSLTKTGTGALEFDGVKLYVADDVIANGNTITFTDDADIGSIDKSSLIIKGGTTNVTIRVSWTSLQSLEISDQAALNIGSSLEVASNITETEAVGTLPEGTRSGITTNYCLVVGTAGDTSTGNVSMAGDITAGSYIHILGNASVGGNVSCIANYYGDDDSHIDIAGNANIGGNLSAVQYINIGGDAEVGGTLSSGKDVTIGGSGTIHGAVNVSGNLRVTDTLTLNQGGTIGGSLLADTIILKGDTSIQEIGTSTEELSSLGEATLIASSGSSRLNATWWTNLKSLQLSDQAKLSFTTSVSVADSISTCEATGTLAEGTEAGLETTYCIYVGTKDKAGTGNVSMAGDITAGSYIHILGNASVGGNVSCIANYYGDDDSHIDIAGNANIGGNLSAVQYINIGGDAEVGGTLSSGKDVTIGGSGTIHGAVNVSGNLRVTDTLTLNQGGTIGGSLLADTIILKGDTSIQEIGTSTEELSSLGEATLIASSGSSRLNATWWTNLKSLQLSDQAKLSFTTSVSVADSISTCEATGTLAEGTEAGLETTYCIYVGTKDKAGTGNVNLAGNMTANAYIEILGDATVTKVNGSLGNVSAREHLFIGGDANIAGNVGTVGKTASETEYGVRDSNITINGDATIGGSLTAVAKESGKKADITIGGNATIGGDLSSTSKDYWRNGASITIEGNATIGGKIQTKGDITIGGNATIGGKIQTSGDITIGGNATFGDEVSGGTNSLFYTNSAGALSVSGDLKGDVEEGHVLVKATSIEVGGTASHVELTANSLKLQDNITLDSVILKQTGSRTMTLNNVTFVGDSGIDGGSSSAESLLTLNANNVTFVLDDSNCQAAVFPFGEFMPLAEDGSTTGTEEVTPRFVISSSILEGVSLTGSVTLDISHWASTMKESGVSTLDLFVGDVVELTESADVVLYDGERYITPIYTENGVQMAIPEPTTATLSLLALAALAARRRR